MSFIKGDFKKTSLNPYFTRSKIIKGDFKIIKVNFKKQQFIKGDFKKLQ